MLYPPKVVIVIKRIISLILIISIVLCLAVPCALAATEYKAIATSLGEFQLHNLYYNSQRVWDENSPLPAWGKFIRGLSTKLLYNDICEVSPDSYHACIDGITFDENAIGWDDYGKYYLLQCNYCDKWFRCYSSDIFDAYDEYVNCLTTPEVSSDGLFAVYPTGWEFNWSEYTKQYLPNTSLTSYNGGFEYSGFVLADISSRYATVYSDAFELPKGSYRLDLTAHSEGSGYGSMSTSWTLYIQGSDDMINWTDIGCASDSVLVGSYTYRPLNFSTIDHDFKYYRCYSYFVSYNGYKAGSVASGKREGHITCLALADADWTNSDTTPESRPVSLMQTINNYNTENNYVDNSTTNYFIGIVDDNGEVTDVYNPIVYDETTKIFTEPVTGAQYQTSGWTYNYLSRTYDIALADNTFLIGATPVSRIELTYGDEAVTLVYYDANNNILGHDDYAYVAVAKDECTIYGHSYTYETIKDATCTEMGERKYTCSRCGNEYAEDIPLAKHTFKVEKKVNTEYGDDGTISVYGYTKYKCEVCGEEKVENDEVDVTEESWFKWLGTQLRKLGSGLVGGLADGIEYLTGTVIKSVTDWSIGLVEWLFGLVDGEVLSTWYSWFDFDNSYIRDEFGTDASGQGAVVDQISDGINPFFEFMHVVWRAFPDVLRLTIVLMFSAAVGIAIVKLLV